MGKENEVKKTPFYNKHVEFGAKIVPFAGFFMPVQYSGIIEEHRRVRETVGVFDVTHMGEFIVKGLSSEKFLNTITINDVSKLAIGQVQYSAMCYPDGGIVDDLLVYRFKDHYMMVVNASNLDKDFDWVNKFLFKEIPVGETTDIFGNSIMEMFFPFGQIVEIENVSDETGLLAVQGPKSFEVLQPLTDIKLDDISFYHFVEGKIAGIDMVISRTGYTGEKGFELYHKAADSEYLWDEIFKAGKSFDIQPIGLGARDTLRLEMKYCLYGNDIDKTTNPLEAGLGWITKFDNGEFIGKESLLKIKETGVIRRFIAFEMIDRGIPRHGYKIYIEGKEVGIVTSGTQSPSLNKGIGLGYVAKEHSKIGTELEIESRGRLLKAKIVKSPFVHSKVS